MKSACLTGAGLLALALAASCGENNNYEKSENSVTTANPPAAARTTTLPARQFVRTADLHIKVKNVNSATRSIENSVARYGGFVAHSTHALQNGPVNTVTVIADSMLEYKTCYTSGEMTLRIPAQFYDTCLREIERNALVIENRSQKADDVGLQLLSNNLLQKREQQSRSRHVIKVNDNNKNTRTISSGFEHQGTTEAADEALIKNLSLSEQVHFSTIRVQLYERGNITCEMLPREPVIIPYAEPLGQKLERAIMSGWKTVEVLIIVTTSLWPALIAGLAVLYLRKRWRKDRSLSAQGS